MVDRSLTLTVPTGAATMTSLASNGGTTTSLAGGFAASTSTDPAFHFDGAITLAGNVTLTSNNNRAIEFDSTSTVNGGYALAVNTGGSTLFGGNIGTGERLASLTTDMGGTTSIGTATAQGWVSSRPAHCLPRLGTS
ncbi:MAG: hypothetical protein ACYS21_21410, partial [Planctomycetota bacterium]